MHGMVIGSYIYLLLGYFRILGFWKNVLLFHKLEFFILGRIFTDIDSKIFVISLLHTFELISLFDYLLYYTSMEVSLKITKINQILCEKIILFSRTNSYSIFITCNATKKNKCLILKSTKILRSGFRCRAINPFERKK